MTKRIYQRPRELSAAQVREALESGDAMHVSAALWSVALYCEDLDCVEQVILEAWDLDDEAIQRSCVQAVGTAARIHREITPALVALVRQALSVEALRGVAGDALSDIQVFAPEALRPRPPGQE